MFYCTSAKFEPQCEGFGYKCIASCLWDLFSQWVIPSEAWPILNEMAEGQQIPAGLHCIIQLFWTHAPAVSELAAAIELLLPPICTQPIEWLLQPCPGCLSNVPPSAKWAQKPHQCLSSILDWPQDWHVDMWCWLWHVFGIIRFNNLIIIRWTFSWFTFFFLP